MTDAAYLAIDWGTTNRRVHLMAADGTVLASERDDRGVKAIAPGGFPAALDAVRARFGPLPAIAAGMVGSTIGWLEAPYVDAPAGVGDLAAALVAVPGADLRIVPGVARRAADGFDVMRGEEVQAIGACAAGLAPADALLCQPGTHNKWIRIAGGAIVDFATAMTGELFALLRDHSVLAGMLDHPVADGDAFRQGVDDARRDPALLTRLFRVRAGVLLGGRSREDAAAYASGLLIGADVASHAPRGATVHLLADPALGALYASAIARCGGDAVRVDSHVAFAAGIHLIRKAARD